MRASSASGDIRPAAPAAPAAAGGPPRPRPHPLRCQLCGERHPAAPLAICENCLGPLEPVYDPARALPDRDTIARRPPSMWRYREWLPFEGEPALSRDTGFTPLAEAPALARRLGVRRAWIKNDAVSHPSLSFKDRVVASAINAVHAFELDVIGCASTGNLANAVAAHAACAGLDAWIFIPDDLEPGKVIGSAIHGPHLVRVHGSYDDVNRLCAQVADRFGWGIANVNLRAYYGEGSKTMAFEIAEQLGWRTPSAVIVPMAGGSLLTKLAKGFAEFAAAGLTDPDAPPPRLYGTQAAGCAPIIELLERENAGRAARIEPVIPHTIARSLAIGNPADGVFAVQAMRESGGWGAKVSDSELVAGIRTLAEDTGIFGETAAGVTVAGALALARAGRLGRDDEVVLCITGHGLKTADVVRDVTAELPVIAPRLREVAALVEAIS